MLTRGSRQDSNGAPIEFSRASGEWQAMRGHAAITFRDSEAPGSNSSSPWLYIQSEARQDMAFHPAPSPRLANRLS